MARDFYDEIVHILRRAGWSKAAGGKGSHEKWIDAEGKRVVIVPRSKSRHTANEVLKQAGLPKAFWLCREPWPAIESTVTGV